MAHYEDLARSVIPLLGDGSVLDIGGGEPSVLAAWRSRGFDAAAADVTGTNVTPGSLPYRSRHFSAVVVAHVFEHTAPEQLDAVIAEAARLTARYLFIKVATRTADGEPALAIEQPRAWWEARLLESGFTKHPLCQRLTSYEALERDEPDVLLAFERVPHQALGRFPLSALREERDLHMDMLREPGRRADAHVVRYTFASQFVHREDRVLDAACGLGYGAAIMHDAAGPVSVHGLDGSEYAVEYAAAVFGSRRPGVTFSKADVMDIAQLPDESIDVVTSFETLEHIADPRSFVREAGRVLAPGGRFLCSVPNRWVDETGRDPNPFHLHVFDREALVALFDAPLRVERIFGQTAGGGMKHPGEPRALYEVMPGDPMPDPEWWLVLAAKPHDGSPVRQGSETGRRRSQRHRVSESRANGVASAFRRKSRETFFRLKPEATHLFTDSTDGSSAEPYERVWRRDEEISALHAEADMLRSRVRGFEEACADHERNRLLRLAALRRRALADPRGIAIFGAGEGGRRYAADWRAAGGGVRCFTDNRRELWGSELKGAPVITPRDLADEGAALIVIASSVGVPEIVRQLEGLGFLLEVDFVRGAPGARS